MTTGAQVRVLGPSRALLAIATGALVAVTSGATAFVVLSGGSGVVATTPPLEPMPPVAAPLTEPPVVVLPPGALGTPAVAAPRRDRAAAPGTARRTSPVSVAAPVLRVPLPAVPALPVPARPVPFAPVTVVPPVLVPAPEPAPVPESPVFAPRAPLPASETGGRAVPATGTRGHEAPSKAAPDEPRKQAKPVKQAKPAKPAKQAKPEADEKSTSAKASKQHKSSTRRSGHRR